MRKTSPPDLAVQNSGLTRKEFAIAHGFGENHMLRIGQGRMNTLSQRTLDVLEAELDRDELIDSYGHGMVEGAYQSWREWKQSQAELPEFIPWEANLSPAERFANAVGSVSKLAQVLCVNDYVVRRWVSGQTRTLPDQMREAMERAGWPHVAALEDTQQAWLDYEK